MWSIATASLLLNAALFALYVAPSHLGHTNGHADSSAQDPDASGDTGSGAGAGGWAKASLWGSALGSARRLESNSLWELFEDVVKDAKFIDLTHSFEPASPMWPGFDPAKFGPAVAGGDFEGFVREGEAFSYAKHGFQATAYHLTTDQYATQLDPPAHWNEFGATISDLPPTLALRPLSVIDISEKCAADEQCVGTVEDVKAYEEREGVRIPEGAVVFFRSDWSKGWASYMDDGLPASFPSVGLDALIFLHNERHIAFHGHEPLDTDMTATLEGEAWLLHHNFAQAEGLTNLDQVMPSGCLVTTGFAKPQGGTGGLAHFVAICPRDHTKGLSLRDAPGAPLPEQKYPLRRDRDGVLRPDPDATPTDYCGEGGAPLGCRPHAKQFVWKQ